MASRQKDPESPKRRFTDQREGSANSIGRDTTITGSIRGTTNLEIWGSFEGEMEIEGLVWIRTGGRVAGELTATDLVVEGELEGNIRATAKIDMRASCRVRADVTAATVAVAEGSLLEGRITVTGTPDEVVGYTERRGRRQ